VKLIFNYVRGELKHVDCDKVGEMVVCSRVVPGVTESTGCTVWAGKAASGSMRV